MGVNQVKFGDATVMDISDSTVAPETLLSGVTAYNKAGNKITGEVVVEHVEVDPVLETGTKSAIITVGEESADIYCENTKTEVKSMKTTQSATITNGIAQFECIDKNFVKALKLTMEPIQDLHGYSNPWAPGAGKNKMPSLVAGTYEVSGLKAVVNENGLVTVTGTKNVSGSVSIDIPFEKSFDLSSATYIHVRNNVSSSNITLDWGVGGWYFAMAPANRIIAPNDNVGVTRLRLYHSSAVTEQLNYTLQLSIETTNSVTNWEPYENICPISGRTEANLYQSGKNMLKVSATSGKIYTVNNDGTILVNGTADGLGLITGYVYVYKPTEVTITGCPSGGSGSTYRLDARLVSNPSVPITGSDEYGNIVSGRTFTVSEPFYVFLRCPNGVVMNNLLFKPMIRLSSETDYTFEPYQGETYTHKYPQEILGGTDDFVNGGATSTDDVLDNLSSLNWYVSNHIFYTKNIDVIDASNVIISDFKCTFAKPVNKMWNQLADGECVINKGLFTSGKPSFVVKMEQYSTVADFKNAIQSDWKFSYPKVTPTTIPTTAEKIATVPGTNIISATEPISECAYRVLEENLSDTIYGNETLVGEDSDVYTLRTAPDISDANYVEENIVGGSVIWNQIIQYAKATYVTENGLTVTNNGDNTVSISGTTNATGMALLTERVQVPRNNHVILYMLNKVIGYNWGISGYGAIAGSADKRFLFFKRNDTTTWLAGIQCSIGSDKTVDIKNVRCSMVDLTRMFGNTGVADYIYTLEQATSGTGIEFLQSHGFFTKDYYDYDAGSLQSVNFNKWFKTSKNLFNLHRLQGVTNIIDGNDVYVSLQKSGQQFFLDYKSYIPGNRTYTLQFDPPSDIAWTYASLRCRLKDNSDFGNVGAIDGWSYQNIIKTYTKSFENASHAEITATVPDCLYCEFGIGTNNSSGNIKENGTYVKFSNIQLEVGSEATDYEPYEGYEISLDDNLDLRGLFRIIDNELVADGDIYEGDGKITRKYGVVDLGTLTWAQGNVGTENAYFYSNELTDFNYISDTAINYISAKYNSISVSQRYQNKTVFINNTKQIIVKDNSYTDVQTFANAMSGVMLQYELAEPILNRGTNFDSPQVFIPNGNEYFVKTYDSTPDRDIDIPAGHVGKYYGKSMFKEISLPTIPKSGGTYILKCNVLADGNKKLYWCADSD